MKIGIDARFYGLENTGLGRYTNQLIKELSKIKTTNKIGVFVNSGNYDEIKIPKDWNKIKIEFRHYSFKEQFKLSKILKKENYDLVHFMHFNVPVFYQGNFVVTIHDLLMHHQKGKKTTTLNPAVYFIKRFGYKYVFYKAVTKSKKIIVPTKVVREDLIRHYGKKITEDKIEVVPEGVDDSFFIKKIKTATLRKYDLSEKRYFVYTGNSYPHKNLSRAIEAISLINEKSSEKIFFVIITARTVFAQKLREQMSANPSIKNIILLDFVPDEDISHIYRGAVGFLYPSLHEGFGLPGLEAMAAGTLALISEIPVFKEVYKDNAIYFNPYDFSSIQKKLEDALKMDQKQREKMILKSQKFVKQYSWSKMAERVSEIYNKTPTS